MTLFHCEGYETLGTTSTTGADLEARINKTPSCNFQEVNGGHTDDIALIAGQGGVGLAMRMPLGLNTRGTFLRMEWPSAYKVSTNASHPVMVTGFRYYNAVSDPAVNRTIWNHMTGATSLGASLSTASNGTDLVWVDVTGTVTISDVITADTWHFIEIEFKPSAGGAGSVEIHVDGSSVYTGTSRNLTSFTFLSSYGVRLGLQTSANETGGNRTAFDDVYQLTVDGVVHTGPLGDVKVRLLTPTSDDAPNTWSRSAGADNFALIDEQDWVTSDYVEADATGEDDHYGLTTLTGAATVHGLQVDVVCQAIDGTPTLHIVFDNGTASEVSGGVIGTATTEVVRNFFATDPSAVAWTQTSVNSVEATQRMTE